MSPVEKEKQKHKSASDILLLINNMILYIYNT